MLVRELSAPQKAPRIRGAMQSGRTHYRGNPFPRARRAVREWGTEPYACLYRRHLACTLVSLPMQAGSLRYATVRPPSFAIAAA